MNGAGQVPGGSQSLRLVYPDGPGCWSLERQLRLFPLM